jgi:hypothetical protein
MVVRNSGRASSSIFGGTALFITTTLYFFINRIEGYSQRAAIEFFEEQQGETCYVITKNYKSYAQLVLHTQRTSDGSTRP